MGRPKGLNLSTLPLYNKLHTKKVKMMCGVEMTALYLVKETKDFFVSTEVWAYCCSKFKAKKPTTLTVDIPVITNTDTIEFLKANCWSDWIQKELDRGNTDITETLEFLSKVQPNKKPIYFYELDSLIGAYNQGTLISYDENGVIEALSEHDIDQQKYYNHKYNRHIESAELTASRTKWTSETDNTLRNQYLTEFVAFEQDYAFKHNNLIDTFIDIGKHSVCFPVGFSKGTADWYKKQYGKVCGYAHVGEIFFVVADDNIFFNITRHY
jgi:hypothetical protein